MNFRMFNERWLHPATQILMILGIVALCQPWSFFLHRYGLTMTLVGLIAFMVTTKIPREEKQDEGITS